MTIIRYLTSLLTFYLKGEIHFEEKFVRLKTPNTILGIIPLGAKNETVPVTQLSSVGSNFKLHFSDLIIGFIVASWGASLISDSFLWGLILLILGVNAVVNAFETTLTIKTTAGDIKNIGFLIFQKNLADEAQTLIRKLISDRLDDTNNRQQTDRIVDAINNK